MLEIKSKGVKALITVGNEGETIPPEEIPFIFDRFHKSDRSRSMDRDGVGLGLYIVKTILNSHRENIRCDSRDGVTRFTFTLTKA
jgi:signal transduction histidine kinase